jgi:hypothetical protein
MRDFIEEYEFLSKRRDSLNDREENDLEVSEKDI